VSQETGRGGTLRGESDQEPPRKCFTREGLSEFGGGTGECKRKSCDNRKNASKNDPIWEHSKQVEFLCHLKEGKRCPAREDKTSLSRTKNIDAEHHFKGQWEHHTVGSRFSVKKRDYRFYQSAAVEESECKERKSDAKSRGKTRLRSSPAGGRSLKRTAHHEIRRGGRGVCKGRKKEALTTEMAQVEDEGGGLQRNAAEGQKLRGGDHVNWSGTGGFL